jgi:hypothetical protein
MRLWDEGERAGRNETESSFRKPLQKPKKDNGPLDGMVLVKFRRSE